MKEVRYWVAEDGTRFNDYFDCYQYERKTELRKFKNDFIFFDVDCRLLSIDRANTDNIEYIIVKTIECAEMLNEWFEEDGVTSPFENRPNEEKTGTFRWESLTSEWKRVENELAELDKLLGDLNSVMIELHS